MNDYDRFAGAFLEEADELLEQLEAGVIALEDDPGDSELVARVFRCLHTLKGSSAMFGFERLSALAHELENAYALVRDGAMPMSRELAGLTLRSADRMRGLVTGQETSESDAAIAEEARTLVSSATGSPVVEGSVARSTGGSSGGGFRIRFVPAPDLLRAGLDPLGVLADLASLGSTTVRADHAGLPGLEEMDPEACALAWDIELATEADASAVRDVFMFAEIGSEIAIDSLAVGPAQVTVEAADPGSNDDRPLLANASASLRVPAHKLDSLVDLVGEIVTAQARLTQYAADSGDIAAAALAEDMERLVSGLRDRVFDVRMVPIASLFSRFGRLVRDLSRQLGKDVRLQLEGGETEFDKTIMDRIADPLVHLVRNCVDHGIEPPDVREAAGKPRHGSIRLAAHQRSGEIVIEVVDDGGGLQVDRIREKAREMGLAEDSIDLTDAIVRPGFSTAEQVTEVSGRGVGLDAVRRTVEDLHGSLRIESEHGAGTRVYIRLPLTLAIVDGLLVRVCDERYVVPLDVVEECVEHEGADEGAERGRRIIDLRGVPVPFVRLREFFSLASDVPTAEMIVVARLDGEPVGIAVDEVIGQQQTVVKRLGRLHRGAIGLSGATVLGDGSVALIVDVPEVARLAEAAERRGMDVPAA